MRTEKGKAMTAQNKPQKMVTLKAHLVLSRRRIERVTVGAPSLAFGEVACGISITLPEAVFQRPALNVSVNLDGPYEYKLTQEIRDDIDALLADVGFNVKIETPETDQ